MIFIGLDDTDNLQSRGTGHLARHIAVELSREFPVSGVIRHQLSKDPRVPCTKNNSSAAICLDTESEDGLAAEIFARVRAMMLADFQPGSDPGLCVASAVPQPVTDFGQRTQAEFVSQQQARDLASRWGLILEGLGGTQDGVIGALAAVGLAACGEDGRYVQVGDLRDLSGLHTISEVLAAGVAGVRTLDGQAVSEGLVLTDKLRPARRGSQPVAVVNWNGDYWLPLKLD